jgi:hypothetical protein
MRNRTGYLLVDHSNSPGLPADVARKYGYNPELCKEGKTFEADTLTCAHCKVTVVKSHTRDPIKMPRATCAKCDHRYICDVCAFQASQPDYVHLPYEKRVQLHFDAAERNRAPPKLILP